MRRPRVAHTHAHTLLPVPHCAAACVGGGGRRGAVRAGGPAPALPGRQDHEQPAPVPARLLHRAQHHHVQVGLGTAKNKGRKLLFSVFGGLNLKCSCSDWAQPLPCSNGAAPAGMQGWEALGAGTRAGRGALGGRAEWAAPEAQWAQGARGAPSMHAAFSTPGAPLTLDQQPRASCHPPHALQGAQRAALPHRHQAQPVAVLQHHRHALVPARGHQQPADARAARGRGARSVWQLTAPQTPRLVSNLPSASCQGPDGSFVLHNCWGQPAS